MLFFRSWQERNSMVTGLTINGILPFGEADGDIKVNAIVCILSYLQQGADNVNIDLRIIVDTATPDSVLFHVEYGGDKAVHFYYNKSDRENEPSYISFGKRGNPLPPRLFVDYLVCAQKSAAA